MNGISAEGMAIARLLGEDSRGTVAWVYRWETGELGILWMSADRHVSGIDRLLDAEVYAQARSVGDTKLATFLEDMPVFGPHDPD